MSKRDRYFQSEPLRLCYLATFGYMERGEPMLPCDGELTRTHLLPRWRIQRVGGNPWDKRVWVWACRYHHELFDKAMLGLPGACVPEATRAAARELGLEKWIATT